MNWKTLASGAAMLALAGCGSASTAAELTPMPMQSPDGGALSVFVVESEYGPLLCVSLDAIHHRPGGLSCEPLGWDARSSRP